MAGIYVITITKRRKKKKTEEKYRKMTTRARHPTHTIKNIWDAEKKIIKSHYGAGLKGIQSRGIKGERKRKKKGKRFFSSVCVYTREPP